MPEGQKSSFGDVPFLTSMLNNWKNDVKIEEVDKRWMLNMKDYLIDLSYDYFDPHREQALLLIREQERTTNTCVSDEIKDIAIKTSRLAGDPSIYFQKQQRIRKGTKIFIEYFKEKENQSKGINYDPLKDEELALTPKDYTKYYYNLARLESDGEDISNFPYVDIARKVVPEEFFHSRSDNILLKRYNEALEWYNNIKNSLNDG